MSDYFITVNNKSHINSSKRSVLKYVHTICIGFFISVFNVYEYPNSVDRFILTAVPN